MNHKTVTGYNITLDQALKQGGFYGPTGLWNSLVKIDGLVLRARVETLVIKKDLQQVYMHITNFAKKKYRIPGGSCEKDVPNYIQAMNECNEEARIKVKPSLINTGVYYIKRYKNPDKWDGIRKELSWVGTYTEVYVGEYDGPFTGEVDDRDKDDAMYKYGKFYPISEVYDILSDKHKEVIDDIFPVIKRSEIKEGTDMIYNDDNKSVHYYPYYTPREMAELGVHNESKNKYSDIQDDAIEWYHEYTDALYNPDSENWLKELQERYDEYMLNPTRETQQLVLNLGWNLFVVPTLENVLMASKRTKEKLRLERERNNDVVIIEEMIFTKKDIVLNIDDFDSGKSNILFITGLSGSGKTTMSSELCEQYAATKLSLDYFQNYHSIQNDPRFAKIKASRKNDPMLIWIDKYMKLNPEIKKQSHMFSNIDLISFKDYFIPFFKWLISELKKDDDRYIVEGLHIVLYIPYKDIKKYPLICINTSATKSLVRHWQRDDWTIKDIVQNGYDDILQFKRWNDMYTDFKKSIDESVIVEAAHPYEFGKSQNLYFISGISMDDELLVPRIPDNYMTRNSFEDNVTPRVCFSATIDGALIGLSQNIKGKKFYVHVPEDGQRLTIIKPAVASVPDQLITHEHWVMENVNLRCIGQIEITGDGDNEYEYTYKKYKYTKNHAVEIHGVKEHKAKLYDWKWRWIWKDDTDLTQENASLLEAFLKSDKDIYYNAKVPKSTKLYHASPSQNLKIIYPNNKSLDPNICNDAVFASSDRRYAACFGTIWSNDHARMGSFDGWRTVVFATDGTIDLDSPCSLYELYNDGSFININKNEMVSYKKARVKTEHKYKSFKSMLIDLKIEIVSMKDYISMMKESYIEEGYFRSTDNLEFNLDKWSKLGPHNLLYITGISGSGKTTLAKEICKKYKAEYIELDKFTLGIVKGLDRWFENVNNGTYEVHPLLKEYFSQLDHITTNGSWSKPDMGDEHTKFLTWFISKTKGNGTLYVVEGAQFFMKLSNMNPDLIKGEPLIIVGTSAFKSWVRRIRRDTSDDETISRFIYHLKKDVPMLFKYYFSNERDLQKYIKNIQSHINESSVLSITEKAKYSPPYTTEEVKRIYGTNVYRELIKDPAHKYRMNTGIELIHKEPTKEELERIWKNWNLMSNDQKMKSDKKSMELFGKTNQDHYNELINSYTVDESSLLEMKRSELDDSEFGLPKLRKYPMPDKDHVLSAIRFFNYVSPENEKELARNIKKKMKQYNISPDRVGDKNRLKKYLTEDMDIVMDLLESLQFANFEHTKPALVFDLGSVLVDNKISFKETLYKSKLIPDDIVEELDAYIGDTYWNNKDKLEYYSEDEFYKYMIDHAPEYLKSYIPAALKLQDSDLRLLDYSKTLIKKLKEKGYKLYYISNWSKWSKDKLTRSGFFDFLKDFDGGIFSGDVGHMKPDNAIFQYFFNKYKEITPTECIFFDDRHDNISAAMNIGMYGILFNKLYTVEWIYDNLINGNEE